MRICLALLIVGFTWSLGYVQTPAQPQPDKKPRVDAYGDPLPEGAVARLGTVRWRHQGTAVFLAFLPDNKTLFSVGRDGEIRLWDVATGKVLRSSAMGFTRPVEASSFSREGMAVAISPDGKTAAACWSRVHSVERSGLGGAGVPKPVADVKYEGPFVQRWELTTGKELPSLQGMDKPAVALDFSSDGKYLACTTTDGSMTIWDTSSGKLLQEFGKLSHKESYVPAPTCHGSLRFTPDGKHLLLVVNDGEKFRQMSVQRWEVATGTMAGTSSHEKSVAILTQFFSHDGKRVYVTTSDGDIVEQEVVSGREIRKIAGDFPRVKGLIASPDSKNWYSRLPGDRTIIEWDAESAKELRHFGESASKGQPLQIYESGIGHACLAVSTDGSLLATGGEGPGIQIYDVASGKEVNADNGHSFAPLDVRFTVDSKSCWTWSGEGTIIEWNCAIGKPIRRIITPAAAESFALSPDGNYLALQMPTGQVLLTNSETGKQLVELTTARPRTISYLFAANGRQLALRNDEHGTITFYDIPLGVARREVSVNLRLSGGSIMPGMVRTALLFSPNGGTLIAHREQHKVGLWTTARGKLSHEIALTTGPNATVRGAAFSFDGRSLAFDIENWAVYVYETSTGKLRCCLGDPNSTKKRKLPSWGSVAYGIIVDFGKPFTYPLCRSSVAFSPNGRILAIRELDLTVTCFDVFTGMVAGRLPEFQGGVSAVAFSPDGKWLATTGADTTTLLWDVTAVCK